MRFPVLLLSIFIAHSATAAKIDECLFRGETSRQADLKIVTCLVGQAVKKNPQRRVSSVRQTITNASNNVLTLIIVDELVDFNPIIVNETTARVINKVAQFPVDDGPDVIWSPREIQLRPGAVFVHEFPLNRFLIETPSLKDTLMISVFAQHAYRRSGEVGDVNEIRGRRRGEERAIGRRRLHYIKFEGIRLANEGKDASIL